MSTPSASEVREPLAASATAGRARMRLRPRVRRALLTAHIVAGVGLLGLSSHLGVWRYAWVATKLALLIGFSWSAHSCSVQVPTRCATATATVAPKPA